MAVAAILSPHAPPATAGAVAAAEDWHLTALGVELAHTISRGRGVTVAVVDSGVEPHPDLRGNLLAGTDLVAGAGRGWEDATGHGTMMAGVIAGRRRLPGGVLGIAPDARILPVRSAGGAGSGQLTVAAGIDYAVAHRARVINVSLATPPAPELAAAVARAQAADVLVVAGVGNRPKTVAVGFPARYAGVLAVGATDRAGRISEMSAVGPRVDIVAPGIDIRSTDRDGAYSRSDGTSSATAMVSGAAALVRARYPQLTARQTAERLMRTAHEAGPPGRDDRYGCGVLDIARALREELAVAATPNPPQARRAQILRTALLLTGIATAAALLVVVAVLPRRRRRGLRRRAARPGRLPAARGVTSTDGSATSDTATRSRRRSASAPGRYG